MSQRSRSRKRMRFLEVQVKCRPLWDSLLLHLGFQFSSNSSRHPRSIHCNTMHHAHIQPRLSKQLQCPRRLTRHLAVPICRTTTIRDRQQLEPCILLGHNKAACYLLHRVTLCLLEFNHYSTANPMSIRMTASTSSGCSFCWGL